MFQYDGAVKEDGSRAIVWYNTRFQQRWCCRLPISSLQGGYLGFWAQRRKNNDESQDKSKLSHHLAQRQKTMMTTRACSLSRAWSGWGSLVKWIPPRDKIDSTTNAGCTSTSLWKLDRYPMQDVLQHLQQAATLLSLWQCQAATNTNWLQRPKTYLTRNQQIKFHTLFSKSRLLALLAMALIPC